MLEERRLDIVIYESILKHLPAGQQLSDDRLNDETLVAAGVAALNEVYGESSPNIIARGVVSAKLVSWRRDSLGWFCGRLSPSNTILHDGCSVYLIVGHFCFIRPGEEYVRFSRFWCESLPENTMAFPGVFKTIKQRSNARFPPLEEDFVGVRVR